MRKWRKRDQVTPSQKVIPTSIWECYFYALWEATFNAFAYDLHRRTPEERFYDIYIGKLAELKFVFQNKEFVEEGVGINSPKPDFGYDFILKKLGKI